MRKKTPTIFQRKYFIRKRWKEIGIKHKHAKETKKLRRKIRENIRENLQESYKDASISDTLFFFEKFMDNFSKVLFRLAMLKNSPQNYFMKIKVKKGSINGKFT